MNKTRTTKIGTDYERKQYRAARKHQELTLDANTLYDEAIQGISSWDESLTAAKMAKMFILSNKEYLYQWRHHFDYWTYMVNFSKVKRDETKES